MCSSLLLGTIVAAVAGGPAEPTVLVSGYLSNAVFRYDGGTGDFVDTLDPLGSIAGPLGVTLGPDDRIYVASELTDSILRFERDTGQFVDVFVAAGTGDLSEPAAVLFGPDRNDDGHDDLYVSSFDGDSVLVFNGIDGSFIETFVPANSGGLNGPDAGMTFGPDGNLYVPSYWSNQVLRYDGADGSFIDVFTPAGNGLLRPRTIVFRPNDGHMLVTAESGNRVLVYHGVTGDFIEELIQSVAGPTGMAIDSAGFLYVASLPADAVYRYDARTGDPVDVVVSSGSGGLDTPTFVLLMETPCPADLDGNGAVGTPDFLALLAAWGPNPGHPADLDGDDEVGTTDFLTLLGLWGPCG